MKKTFSILGCLIILASFSVVANAQQQVTDVEGNIYKTVHIGTQVWMAENLRTTKFNDQKSIPLVSDTLIWSTMKTPGYCWYNNDKSANKDLYGALYNGYTVSTGKLCLTGWHVPTNTEWRTLITYLGGAAVAGSKLKETDTTHWNSPNYGATNESGFTALPGGDRHSFWNNTYGKFTYLGDAGFWWSATVISTEDIPKAWSYVQWGSSNILLEFSNNYRLGFSVRCILD